MKVAIAGYGVEGKQNYAYWRERGDDVTIVDEREAIDDLPDGVPTVLGPNAFEKLADFDLVVRTAGLAPRKIHTGGKIWSATNEFFAKCSVPIIGVTGTKGKGTTSSLITGILREAGKTVHLVGNIGQPALEILPQIQDGDIVVYELSSFQLWDLEKSPHIAVVLPIEPDHLDVHASFEEYIDAKANIRRHQTLADVCIYHPTNQYSYQIAATVLDAVKHEKDNPHCEVCAEEGYETTSIDFAHRYAVPNEDQVYVENDDFCVQGRTICSTDNLKLPGKHNIENACAAMSAVAELLYNTITDEQYAAGLRNFTGLPHRLKFVAEKNGVKYYDDSIATTPGSAIAAIKAFREPKIIILGGSDKGADYDHTIELCREMDVKVIAIGQTGGVIADLCDELGVIYIREEGDMTAIVKKADEVAHSGDVVILSPASASFDMFKNYADRGDQFIAAVNAL